MIDPRQHINQTLPPIILKMGAANFTTMKKQQKHAFRKDIYFLWKDADGTNYWLEAPSFDCGWYWGFGYVETYTNNQNPEKSKDISTHRHMSGFIKSGEIFNQTSAIGNKEAFIELFNKFYSLAKEAAAAHRTEPDKWKELNTVAIPETMKAILQMISPTPDTITINIPKL